VVLFGGGTAGDLLGDIWEWDGTRWTKRTPTSGPAPPPRQAHNLVYDAMHARVVLFGGVGGIDGSTPLNDVWTWDGVRWTELALQPAPSPRLGAAMACDTAHGYLILFGGGGLHDTWFLGTEDPTDPDEPCYVGDCRRGVGRHAPQTGASRIGED